MMNVEFRTYKLWDKMSNGSDEISFSEVKPIELYDWLKQPENKLKGGYCISVVNKAWNGYWDEEMKAEVFYIDHIEGALKLLKAFNDLNSPNVKFKEIKRDVRQCNGSSLELSLYAPNMLCMKDTALKCEDMTTGLDFITFLFQKATLEFQDCIKEVLALCSEEDELRKELEYYLEQTEQIYLKKSYATLKDKFGFLVNMKLENS